MQQYRVRALVRKDPYFFPGSTLEGILQQGGRITRVAVPQTFDEELAVRRLVEGAYDLDEALQSLGTSRQDHAVRPRVGEDDKAWSEPTTESVDHGRGRRMAQLNQRRHRRDTFEAIELHPRAARLAALDGKDLEDSRRASHRGVAA